MSDAPNNTVSPFPYPGGKGRKADWILEKMPPHKTFVDVFGGSGAIIYNKPPSKWEVYNDVNDDLVQFYEILREREDELVEWLESVPYARSVYEEWVDDFFAGIRPDDSVERAGRFFTLRYMQFAGDISGRNGFKTRAKRSPAQTFDNSRGKLQQLADRFSDVVIENQDYADIFATYDDTSTEVLFYCDPPYVGGEGYYPGNFDHQTFVDCLRDADSRWMVSYTELPEGLEEYHVVERRRRHRMCRGASDATERLVCNFDSSSTASFVGSDQHQESLQSFTKPQR